MTRSACSTTWASRNVHLMGLVGMGACVCQEIAIRTAGPRAQHAQHGRLVRSRRLPARPARDVPLDPPRPRLLPFQKAVTLLSFDAEFYNANKERLLGPDGGWKELNGRYEAHSRLIDACVGFDSKGRLQADSLPVADHPRGQGRRHGAAHDDPDRAGNSRREGPALGGRRARRRRQGAEDPLRQHAVRVAALEVPVLRFRFVFDKPKP